MLVFCFVLFFVPEDIALNLFYSSVAQKTVPKVTNLPKMRVYEHNVMQALMGYITAGFFFWLLAGHDREQS